MYAQNGWHMAGGGGIGMVLFWILAILAVVWLVRELDLGRSFSNRDRGEPRSEPRSESRAEGHGWSGDGALRILRERYARGEIDEDEFQSRKRALVSDGNG